jgi:hypothetical protein
LARLSRLTRKPGWYCGSRQSYQNDSSEHSMHAGHDQTFLLLGLTILHGNQPGKSQWRA